MSGHKGFTLLELLVTLGLIGVLLGLSTPGLQTLVQQKEGETALRAIVELLAVARSTAVTSGVTTTFCRSLDGHTCSGDWIDGGIVFTDRNRDRVVNQDDRIIRTGLTNLQGHIAWRAFQNRQFLQVEATGFLRHQGGNFTYCPVNGDPRLARQLIINSTGRVRYAPDSDGDGVREDSNGQPLRC